MNNQMSRNTLAAWGGNQAARDQLRSPAQPNTMAGNTLAAWGGNQAARDRLRPAVVPVRAPMSGYQPRGGGGMGRDERMAQVMSRMGGRGEPMTAPRGRPGGNRKAPSGGRSRKAPQAGAGMSRTGRPSRGMFGG